MTAVRKTICGVILDHTSAFDAEELLAECRKEDGLISLSTVYRTIRHLVEAGLLSEIEGVSEKRLFNLKLGHDIGDSTVVCTDCNTVFPVQNPCLALREGDLAKKMGLTPKRMSLKIESSCKSFQESGECDKKTAAKPSEK